MELVITVKNRPCGRRGDSCVRNGDRGREWEGGGLKFGTRGD